MESTFTLCLIFALWSNLVAELLDRNCFYSTRSSANTHAHKNKEALVLHKKKKKSQSELSTPELNFDEQKISLRANTHINKRIKRNPKRANRVFQLRNQAFCQLCRTLSADSRACKGVGHTTKTPPKKKKEWERRIRCHFWSSSW